MICFLGLVSDDAGSYGKIIVRGAENVYAKVSNCRSFNAVIYSLPAL